MWVRGAGDGRQNEQTHINLGESHRRRGHKRGMMGLDGAVMGRVAKNNVLCATPPPKARIRLDP